MCAMQRERETVAGNSEPKKKKSDGRQQRTRGLNNSHEFFLFVSGTGPFTGRGPGGFPRDQGGREQSCLQL